MSLPWVLQSISALPDHCQPSSPFLAKLSSTLHICLPTPLALLSSTLGALSIVSWLFAQLPQIYKNYSIQSTAGLSALFLVEWCLGDSANLIGAVLTNQAGWQVAIAAYYVFVDVVLVYQYFWYTHLKPKWRFGYNYSEIDDGGGNGNGQPLQGVVSPRTRYSESAPVDRLTPSLEPKDAPPRSLQTAGSSQSSSFVSNEKPKSSGRTILRAGPSGTGTPIASPRTILLISMLCAVMANASSPATVDINVTTSVPRESAGQITGRISSWISTVMYLASRMPQIYKNYRRKSTSGLSPLLFGAAFCGNLFYSSSLMSNPNAWFDFLPYGGGGWAGPEGNDKPEWVGRAIPFFLGAAGVLVLDGAVGVQFLLYAEKREGIVVKANELGRGRLRWQNVTGWMRGWVPSLSPDRSIPREETRPLLAHGQGNYGGV